MAVDLHSSELRIVGPDNDTVLDLRPIQGLWTEEQYLALTDHSRRLLEFDDGYIEVLPMPTDKHQAISQFIFLALLGFIQGIGGKVQYAPLRLQIRPGKHREPDILLVRDANDPRRQTATGSAPISSSRSSARTTPSAIRRSSEPTMLRPVSPSTGSSTPRTRRSSFYSSRVTLTLSTAASAMVRWQPRCC